MKFGRSKPVEQSIQVGICMTTDGIAIASIDGVVQTGQLPRIKLCQFIASSKKGDRAVTLTNFVKMNKLEGLLVTCILPASQYDLFLIEDPEVVPEELLAAVRWKVKDYLEYPIGEAMVDYIALPAKTMDVKGKMGYAVVVKQSVIDETVQLVNSVGLKVITVDIAESAICALMSHLKEVESGILCFRLLPGISQIILIKKGLIMLMRNLDLNQEYLLNTQDSADKKEKMVNDMALEIQRSLEYSATNLKQDTIQNVIFTPMNSALEPLIGELKTGLSMNMRLMQLSEVVNGLQKMSLMEQGQCLLALGGALKLKVFLK